MKIRSPPTSGYLIAKVSKYVLRNVFGYFKHPILTKHGQETPPCRRIIQLFKIIKFQNVSFKIKTKLTNTKQTKIRRFFHYLSSHFLKSNIESIQRFSFTLSLMQN